MQKLIQDNHFGRNLQKLRKARNLSQSDIIREMALRGRGMSRASYAHIEQGVRNIFINDLILLRDILGVSYDAFFEGLHFIPENPEE